jgi:hypothetical protein
MDSSREAAGEKETTASNGCCEKWMREVTEACVLDEPDWFAPLRWPGWLGSLGTFIGGITLQSPYWKMMTPTMQICYFQQNSCFIYITRKQGENSEN